MRTLWSTGGSHTWTCSTDYNSSARLTRFSVSVGCPQSTLRTSSPPLSTLPALAVVALSTSPGIVRGAGLLLPGAQCVTPQSEDCLSGARAVVTGDTCLASETGHVSTPRVLQAVVIIVNTSSVIIIIIRAYKLKVYSTTNVIRFIYC